MLRPAAQRSFGSGDSRANISFLAVFLQMGRLRCEGQTKVTQALGELEESRATACPLGLCLSRELVGRRRLPACLPVFLEGRCPHLGGGGGLGRQQGPWSQTHRHTASSAKGRSPGIALRWDLTFLEMAPRPRVRRVLLPLHVFGTWLLSVSPDFSLLFLVCLFFISWELSSPPPFVSTSSFFFSLVLSPHLPFCLLSLWSPLGLCSRDGTDGAPPSSQGSPDSLESPSRVFLQ